MKEMQEERKQMKNLMEKNSKLMAILESNISGKTEMAATRSPGGGKVKKEKCTCKHCRKPGYHEDAACFSLPENAHLHPDWFKE